MLQAADGGTGADPLRIAEIVRRLEALSPSSARAGVLAPAEPAFKTAGDGRPIDVS